MFCCVFRVTLADPSSSPDVLSQSFAFRGRGSYGGPEVHENTNAKEKTQTRIFFIFYFLFPLRVSFLRLINLEDSAFLLLLYFYTLSFYFELGSYPSFRPVIFPVSTGIDAVHFIFDNFPRIYERSVKPLHSHYSQLTRLTK